MVKITVNFTLVVTSVVILLKFRDKWRKSIISVINKEIVFILIYPSELSFLHMGRAIQLIPTYVFR